MLRLLPVLLLTVLLTACNGESNDGGTAPKTSTAPAAAAPSEPAEGPTKPVAYNADAPDNYLRPNYHFTPPAGWMNDPNGMVYHEGEWHLFYQHFPDDNVWGPMHWGHAVSTDLLAWEHLPIALYPDERGYIFSGSAVVDKGNTSGFGEDGKDPLVAIFTYHDIGAEKAGAADYESQGIAYSNDRGRTWTKYAGNPVIPNRGVKDFRDPKVFWDEQHEQWTMVLAAKDRVQFFASSDLKSWVYLSDFGQNEPNHTGVWECPELLRHRNVLTGEMIYLLTVSINPGGANGGSGTMYWAGDWDGKTFTPATDDATTAVADTVNWVDYGRDNYAGVTFSGAPGNRNVYMGWMSNWDYAQVVPTTSWRSAMTIPRDLHVTKTSFGTRLRQLPVPELKKLRGEKIELEMPRLPDGVTTVDLSQLETNGAYELELAVDLVGSDAEELYVTLSTQKGDRFYRFGYRRTPGEENVFFTDRRRSGPTDFSEKFAPENLTVAPRWSNEGILSLRIFFDRTSAEVFCDQGEPVLTDIFFPEEPFTMLSFEVSGSVGEGMPEGWRLAGATIWGLNN